MTLKGLRRVLLALDCAIERSKLNADLAKLDPRYRKVVRKVLHDNGFCPTLFEGAQTPSDLILAMLAAAELSAE